MMHVQQKYSNQQNNNNFIKYIEILFKLLLLLLFSMVRPDNKLRLFFSNVLIK